MNRVERPLGERAQAMIDALASITAEPGKLTRLYLTEEHREAARLVAPRRGHFEIGQRQRDPAVATDHVTVDA